MLDLLAAECTNILYFERILIGFHISFFVFFFTLTILEINKKIRENTKGWGDSSVSKVFAA